MAWTCLVVGGVKVGSVRSNGIRRATTQDFEPKRLKARGRKPRGVYVIPTVRGDHWDGIKNHELTPQRKQNSPRPPSSPRGNCHPPESKSGNTHHDALTKASRLQKPTLHSPLTHPSHTMSMASKNFAKPMGEGSANKDSGNYSPDTFKVLLKKLVQSPTEFTAEDCATAFRHLCVQAASDAQVRGTRGALWWDVLTYPGRSVPHCVDAFWTGQLARARCCLCFGVAATRYRRQGPQDGDARRGDPTRPLGLFRLRQRGRWVHGLRRYRRDRRGRVGHL